MAEALTKVVTPKFRVSFPSVFVPSSFDGGDGASKPKYSVVALFTPAEFTDADKDAWRKMCGIANAQAKDGFKKELTKELTLPPPLVTPFRRGEEKAELEGYGEGVVFMTFSSHMKPGLIDRDRQPILDQEAFYAGCYARATVTAYWYPKDGSPKKKKGVGFGLHNLQKLADGESFSGRVAAEDDFADDLGGDGKDPW